MGDRFTIMETLSMLNQDHYLVMVVKGEKTRGTLGLPPASPSSTGNYKKKAIASHMVCSNASNDPCSDIKSILKSWGLN